jgi:hypothetical protein
MIPVPPNMPIPRRVVAIASASVVRRAGADRVAVLAGKIGNETMKKFVQDLWKNPFFWLTFAVVVVIKLIL